VHPIDLLPDLRLVRRQQLVMSLPRLLLIALVVWVLLLGSAYAWVSMQKQAVQAQLADVTQQTDALEPVAQRVKQRDLLAGQVRDLESLLGGNTKGYEVPLLDLLSELLPGQISVGHVAIADGVITFSCESSDLIAIGRLQNNLSQTPGVSDVSFSAIAAYSEQMDDGVSQWERRGYTFSVSFRFGG